MLQALLPTVAEMRAGYRCLKVKELLTNCYGITIAQVKSAPIFPFTRKCVCC